MTSVIQLRFSRSRLALAQLLLVVLLWPNQALAYIDPGTGSALVYLVTAIVVSVGFAIRGLYYRVIEQAFRHRYPGQKCEIAIHSEDPRYEITFLPVLRSLHALGLQATYFTMYERKEDFEELPESTTHQLIAPGLVGYSYLNHIEATILVTTTPQIDVMTFRRSKKVKHYCMLSHALGESRYVRPFSYDFFDSVLCCGKTLRENIRRIEEIRQLKSKLLLETGVPHYDELAISAQRALDTKPETPDSEKKTLLIAPSWGPLSLFESFGTDFVEDLTHDYRVIVRPHPHLRVNNKELFNKVTELRNVEIDTSRTPQLSLAKADFLISDISGIMHEAAFIFEIPVLIVEQPQKQGGLEGELLGGDSELKERCREIIVPMPADQMQNLGRKVNEVFANFSKTRASEVRDDVVFNYGKAGQVAARQIQQIAKDLQ